jgi:hypothetical protein
MPLQQGKQKLFTTKTVNSLLIISGIYVLLPFLYITRYDYPSADDYGFAIWFSQHGLLHMIKQQYLGWGGRYLLAILYRLNPTVAHSLLGYRLCSAGVILLFAAVVVVTMRSLFKDHLSRRQTLGLSALFMGLYFAKTPGTAEGFYWYSSYAIYQLPNIFFLLLLAALVRIHRQATPAPALLAWSSLLCILIIGCNEVSLIMTCLFIGYLALIRYLKDRRLTRELAILCGICVIFALIEIAAPGNFARMSMVRRNFGSILWTFTGSLATTAIYGSQWIGPLLAASVLYIPLFGLPLARRMAAGQPAGQPSTAAGQPAGQPSIAAPESTAARQPFALSVRGFAWSFAGSLVFLLLFVMWTTNGSDLERVLNVVYFYVIAGYFFLLQLLLNKYLPRLEFIDRHRTGFAVLGLALFAVTLLDLNNNVSTAYVDLLSGKARAYEEALAARDTTVSACKSDTCKVPALTDVPATIFFTDIRPLSDRSGIWINLHYSNYWHAGLVIPDAAPPLPVSNLETLRNLGKSMRNHIEKK